MSRNSIFVINMKLSQLERSGSSSMLKRRPSKRFVLAETGEESAWNTTTDNDPEKPTTLPQIEIQIGLTPVPSSSQLEEVEEVTTPVTPNALLLSVPMPIKSGMK